jgi:membrane dipeptidase
MSIDNADDLHRDSIVIDAHCDAVFNALGGPPRLGQRSSLAQFDLPRALEGGLTAEFMAMQLDSRGPMDAHQLFRYLDTFFEELVAAPDLAVLALSAQDIRQAKALGKVALVLSLEGVEGLMGNLAALRVCHRLGVRAVGITWNLRNAAADGVAELRTGGGLTEFGVGLVNECNRLGMLIDMAHLAPAGVRDVLGLSDAPVVVSHANCAALWPHRRNLTDAQLEAIAKKGGVVGVTLVPSFLGPDELRCPLSAVLDHIDHAVAVMGEDGVGLGSDFEGVGSARVDGLDDVAKLPNLTREMVLRGYSAVRIGKILGGNFLRVFQQVC